MSVTDIIAITGASSGIGAATARLLAARGHKLALGARRTDRLEALAQELPTETLVVPLDVTDRAAVTQFIQATTDRFGRLDALVNNAGIARTSPVAELDVEGWEAMIDVNLKGVLYGIAAALPVFEAQGRGHIVNVASTAGHRLVPTMAVYAATKTAVRQISEVLRQESDGRVRVSIVSPGMTNTELAEGIPDFAIAPDAIAQAIAFAIEQPADVEVGEIVVRPAAQG
jgi:NADP-dependent 3-hydroxy acid dehydrogenase YdfG